MSFILIPTVLMSLSTGRVPASTPREIREGSPMNQLPTILICLVMLLVPLLSATPEEPLWSAIFCALTMLALVLMPSLTRKDESFLGKTSAARFATIALLVLLGLGLLSIFARLSVQHSTHAYLDIMLRAWSVLATNIALFLIARRSAEQSRAKTYAIVLSALLGSAILSGIGVQEYLIHLRAHESQWRVFATSTPDYLAGYLVMMLPVTLALCLGAPAVGNVALLFGLAVLLQLGATFTTGSRFALISLALAFVVLAAAIWTAIRQGMTLEKPVRQRMIGLVVFGVLAVVLVAGPVIHRLRNMGNDANSGAFRIWTWRGSVQMAKANPMLGTGIGTYIDLYPKYALTGFTRLAHNSYLQTADEIGFPALIALLAGLGCVVVGSWRGLRVSKETRTGDTEGTDFVTAIAPSDDRLLQCGLLAGLAAGMIQNLIDSDWYVFFLGSTFWMLAGLSLGLASRSQINPDTVKARRPMGAQACLIGVGILVFVYQIANAVAAGQVIQGRALATQGTIESAQNAVAAYQDARIYAPLNGVYPSELGYNVYYKGSNNLPDAQTALQTAIELEPNAVNSNRLGKVLAVAGRQSDAIAAFENGLKLDPNSLDLLLSLASVSSVDQALRYYRRMADLEETPVGTVRAIGITEVKFAYADQAVANAAYNQHNLSDAAKYAERAARLLEAYAAEGGSTNGQRQAMRAGKSDPEQDRAMAGMYHQVMGIWQSAAASAERATIAEREKTYGQKFEEISKQP